VLAWVAVVGGIALLLLTWPPVLDRLPWQKPFRVWITEEQFTNEGGSLILQARLVVRNTTGQNKQLMAWRWVGQMGGPPNIEAQRAAPARERQVQSLLASTVVEPHSEVAGWLVRAFAGAGKPSYELSVQDEFQHWFRARKSWFWRWK
jgi:hypothetical protein